jgi:drug/metabolite transporter (DMT)-like permease
VLFAALSAAWLAGEPLTARLLLGAGLIVGASLLSALREG